MDTMWGFIIYYYIYILQSIMYYCYYHTDAVININIIVYMSKIMTPAHHREERKILP